MQTLLEIVAIKALGALLLALVVALASRRIERPALVHALWIVVLLELLVPPVLEIGVLPRSDPAPVAQAVLATPAVAPRVETAVAARLPRLGDLLLGGWLVGLIAILLLTGLRLVRLRRLLAGARNAPAELQTAADELARRLGLARSPRVRLVPIRISPLVRGRLGRPEILFPCQLLGQLDRAERDTLLTHELAHVRRKDPWVRYLEWIAGSLFWWHPVVWWARRRLRLAEEMCCDALVLRTLPSNARDYANALVKTVEFLAGARTGVPLLASGVGEVDNLKERLTMIVQRSVPRSPTPMQKVILGLGALFVLAVAPTWADRDDSRSSALLDQQRSFELAREEMGQSVLQLERQAVELERQLRAVRLQQMELRQELESRRESMAIGRLEREAARLEETGRHDEADRLRDERQSLQRVAELETVLEREFRIQEDQDRRIEEAIHRSAFDRMRADMERLRAEGEHEKARELELEFRQYQLELEQSARRESLERELQQQIRKLKIDLERNPGAQ